MPTDDEKFFADLWIKHAELFLKVVAFVPVIQLGIMAGWYALMKDEEPVLARSLAGFGVLVMLVASFILNRTSWYVWHFRQRLETLLAGNPHNPIRGKWLGLSLPLLCVLVNLVLAMGLVSLKRHVAPVPSQSQSSN